jgi:hypothetical protein
VHILVLLAFFKPLFGPTLNDFETVFSILSFFFFLWVKHLFGHEFYKLYFLVLEFQFASQMVPQFWEKTELVPRLSFSSKN